MRSTVWMLILTVDDVEKDLLRVGQQFATEIFTN